MLRNTFITSSLRQFTQSHDVQVSDSAGFCPAWHFRLDDAIVGEWFCVGCGYDCWWCDISAGLLSSTVGLCPHFTVRRLVHCPDSFIEHSQSDTSQPVAVWWWWRVGRFICAAESAEPLPLKKFIMMTHNKWIIRLIQNHGADTIQFTVDFNMIYIGWYI